MIFGLRLNGSEECDPDRLQQGNLSEETLMNWLMAAWLVLVIPVVQAVECGPLITSSQVSSLDQSLSEALSLLMGHEKSLGEEIENRLANARSDIEFNRINKISNESDQLRNVSTLGQYVQFRLEALGILISIRDVMVAKLDRTIVEKYLSLMTAAAKQTAEIGYKQTNTVLAKVSRPGIAIDVSKLRDAIGKVVSEFHRCEIPKTK